MFISQIFILSPRGDNLVFKDYRQDVPRNADEMFFRHFKFWDGRDHQAVRGDCPPFFSDKGVQYCFVRRSNMLFVATSLANVSPSLTVELLTRVVKVIKDFLGVLSEESVRKNFALVYELLDEMIDVGVAQELGSERLRPYVFTEVVPVAPSAADSAPSGGIVGGVISAAMAVAGAGGSDGWFDRVRRGELMVERTRRSDAAQQSIVQGGARKNEIYIDIIERLSVVFDASGAVVASEVDGSITIKSFLAGSPTLIMGLNEDLVVGRGDSARMRYATVVLDSVNFHEAADHSRFESERTLSMRPPDGEFTLMNYRVTGEGMTQPFRLTPSVEVQSSYKLELTLRVRADIPVNTSGLNVAIRVPLPRSLTSLGVEFGVGATGQSYEHKQGDRQVTWLISKFVGGTEQVCKIRISTSTPITAATRRELGPISMAFEVPLYNVSGLGIKSLRLEERSQSYNPSRWVRNITQAASYVIRTS